MRYKGKLLSSILLGNGTFSAMSTRLPSREARTVTYQRGSAASDRATNNELSLKSLRIFHPLVFIKVLLTDLVLPSFMYANSKAWFSLATKKCNWAIGIYRVKTKFDANTNNYTTIIVYVSFYSSIYTWPHKLHSLNTYRVWIKVLLTYLLAQAKTSEPSAILKIFSSER